MPASPPTDKPRHDFIKVSPGETNELVRVTSVRVTYRAAGERIQAGAWLSLKQSPWRVCTLGAMAPWWLQTIYPFFALPHLHPLAPPTTVRNWGRTVDYWLARVAEYSGEASSTLLSSMTDVESRSPKDGGSLTHRLVLSHRRIPESLNKCPFPVAGTQGRTTPPPARP